MPDNEAQRQHSPNYQRLLDSVNAAEAEAAKWKGLFDGARSDLISSAVHLAGFTPNDDGVFDGVAGLLVERFVAELGAEDMPDAGAFSEIAQQYGVAPSAPEASTPLVPVDPRRAEAERRSKDLAGAFDEELERQASLANGNELRQRIDEAEAAGDAATSIRLQQELSYGAG